MSKETRQSTASGGFVPSEKADNHMTNPQVAIPHASGEFDAESNTYITATATQDIIYTVARRFGITVKDLMDANGLELPVISAGQQLLIPVTKQNGEAATGTSELLPGDIEKDKELLKIKSYLDTLDEYKNDAAKRDAKASAINYMLTRIRQNLRTKKTENADQTEEETNTWHEELLRVFDQMLSASPAYYLMDEELLKTETIFRTSLIINSRLSIDRGCRYGNEEQDTLLDNNYWNENTFRNYLPQKNVKPSDAVNSIFKPGTLLECDTMLTSNVYKTMLDMMGPEKFNERFGEEGKLRISETGMEQQHTGELINQGYMKLVTIGKFEELIPGDWVYFVNIPYYKTTSKGGAFGGENAVYEGYASGEVAKNADKNKAKFSGFGLENQTYESMLQNLKDAYKSSLENWSGNDKKKQAIMSASALLSIHPWMIEDNLSFFEVEFIGENGAKVKLGTKEVTLANIYEPQLTNGDLPFTDYDASFKQTIENSFPGISVIVKRPIAEKIKG